MYISITSVDGKRKNLVGVNGLIDTTFKTDKEFNDFLEKRLDETIEMRNVSRANMFKGKIYIVNGHKVRIKAS